MIELPFNNEPLELIQNRTINQIESILYLDECGQHNEKDTILGSIGGVLIYKDDEKKINEFVDNLWNCYENEILENRRNLFKNGKSKKSKDSCLSGSSMPNEALEEIANFIKERKWLIVGTSIYPRTKDYCLLKNSCIWLQYHSQLISELEVSVKNDLRFSKAIRESKTKICEQIISILSQKDKMYWLMNLEGAFENFGTHFKSQNIIPIGKIYFDEKLSKNTSNKYIDLVNLVVCFHYLRHYSESMNKQAYILASLYRGFNNNFEIVEDDDKKNKGLQLADVCVWAWRISQYHNTSAFQNERKHQFVEHAVNVPGCIKFRQILEPNYLVTRKSRLEQFGITTND